MSSRGKEITNTILKILEVIAVLLVTLVAVLISVSISWLFKTWNALSMSELVYQLNAPMTGTNADMVLDYIQYCIPAVILTFLLFFIFMIGLRKAQERWRQLFYGTCFILSLILAGSSIFYAWNRLDVDTYLQAQGEDSSWIDENYVDPASVAITFPEEKRNLVYIFLESMEATYSSTTYGGGFYENFIPELTELSLENENFSGSEKTLNGAYTMPYATWTVAGMFAQSSGLPLAIPLENNEMDTQDTFFPGATLLGDILEDAGYSQTLFIGSDATFGGRRLMYTEHGNFDIRDYNLAAETGRIPEGYHVFWGFEDERLFEFAKEDLLDIAAEDQPFNFTILSVDTHFEDGYVCDLCEDDHNGNKYGNVINCSSRQVADFVHWIQEQDFYENTTIVISGDHLTMDSDFCDDVDEDYDRKVYTAYINSAVEPVDPDERREYTTFDDFPTTLASLGATIEGERLGLGTNLFSDTPTLTEMYGVEMETEEMNKSSDTMDKLTEDIVEVEKEETDDQEKPSCDLTLQNYDSDSRIASLAVTELAPDDILCLNVAVWTDWDQSDLQWIQSYYDYETESFTFQINIADFNYATTGYNVHVYQIDQEGNQSVVASFSMDLEDPW